MLIYVVVEGVFVVIAHGDKLLAKYYAQSLYIGDIMQVNYV